MQHCLGVRLPLLQPCAWSLHHPLSNGIGIVSRSCRMVTHSDAVGEAREDCCRRPHQNLRRCTPYRHIPQALYDVRPGTNIAHRWLNNQYHNTSHRPLIVGIRGIRALYEDEAIGTTTRYGRSNSHHYFEQHNPRALRIEGQPPHLHLGVRIGSLYGLLQEAGIQIPNHHPTALDILHLSTHNAPHRCTRDY